MTHNPPVCCVRGLARLLSVVVIGLVLLIFVGEGGDALLRLSATESLMMVVFWSAIVGLAVAWHAERFGGGLAVGGILLFCALNWFFVGSFPKSWLFLLAAIPGVLFMIAATLEKNSTRRIGV